MKKLDNGNFPGENEAQELADELYYEQTCGSRLHDRTQVTMKI